mmetsp:Transcript_71358/g.221312  ORF Transcript_71358/g.221312 Transcript_71358/m.221312 type:complete len:408 (-) Transcript_71358:253-1476(-)
MWRHAELRRLQHASPGRGGRRGLHWQPVRLARGPLPGSPGRGEARAGREAHGPERRGRAAHPREGAGAGPLPHGGHVDALLPGVAEGAGAAERRRRRPGPGGGRRLRLAGRGRPRRPGRPALPPGLRGREHGHRHVPAGAHAPGERRRGALESGGHRLDDRQRGRAGGLVSLRRARGLPGARGSRAHGLCARDTADQHAGGGHLQRHAGHAAHPWRRSHAHEAHAHRPDQPHREPGGDLRLPHARGAAGRRAALELPGLRGLRLRGRGRRGGAAAGAHGEHALDARGGRGDPGARRCPAAADAGRGRELRCQGTGPAARLRGAGQGAGHWPHARAPRWPQQVHGAAAAVPAGREDARGTRAREQVRRDFYSGGAFQRYFWRMALLRGAPDARTPRMRGGQPALGGFL